MGSRLFLFMKNTLSKYLQWYDRHPSLPTSPEDRAVRRLVYTAGNELEMGLVCESQDGGYIAYSTTSGMKPPPLDACLKRRSLRGASSFLYTHILTSLYEVFLLKTDLPFSLRASEIQFKVRDKKAFVEYTNEISDSPRQAFKCGIDWMSRSEGFPRRPSWARYLVQNRDGTLTWFEEEPCPDYNTGVWVGRGKNRTVSLATPWDCGVKRLTSL